MRFLYSIFKYFTQQRMYSRSTKCWHTFTYSSLDELYCSTVKNCKSCDLKLNDSVKLHRRQCVKLKVFFILDLDALTPKLLFINRPQHNLTSAHNVGLALLLKVTGHPSRASVCIGNTHLLYNPKRGAVVACGW